MRSVVTCVELSGASSVAQLLTYMGANRVFIGQPRSRPNLPVPYSGLHADSPHHGRSPTRQTKPVALVPITEERQLEKIQLFSILHLPCACRGQNQLNHTSSREVSRLPIGLKEIKLSTRRIIFKKGQVRKEKNSSPKDVFPRRRSPS